jgi:uncharacterized protein YjbJ (UPF0337 family)
VAAGSWKEDLVMPNEQQLEGNLEQGRGNVKEAIGDAIGNEQMEHEGKWDQAKGNVREGVGDLREGIDDAADDLKRDDYNR